MGNAPDAEPEAPMSSQTKLEGGDPCPMGREERHPYLARTAARNVEAPRVCQVGVEHAQCSQQAWTMGLATKASYLGIQVEQKSATVS